MSFLPTDVTRLKEVSAKDVAVLVEKGRSYGDSWRARGGVGAFMMLARKWDRLENACKDKGWDIERVIREDERAEGVIDDIRDLRRYLLLVEEKWGALIPQAPK